ncbi:dephospho-CoA kinase [Candidatus Woesearchaeota archaeon]|nr:dephospho-CoA kinase [Candidatus Woesearchaeota archaeon]
MVIIIGLTGPIASGKDIVANYLVKKGFSYYSLSQIVRDEADSKGLSKSREILQNIGNELRNKHGNKILAERIINKIDFNKNSVIDSIRNPGEIEILKKLGNFLLIGVTASIDTRFKRLLIRNKESDPKTYDEFLRLEARDRGINEPNSGQQVQKCLELADIQFVNEFNSIDEFEKQIEILLQEKKIIST